MHQIHSFLVEVKLSPEFRVVALAAAKTAGYDTSSGDSLNEEDLNRLIAQIIAQVMLELSDERFRGRTHHRRSLYNRECRGPLCRKAERDRSRARYRQAHVASPLRINRRASVFEDQILDYIAQKYESRMSGAKGDAA